MTFDEIDEETEVSQGEAIAELEKHYKNVKVLGVGELYDIDEQEIIAESDGNGNYLAMNILNWLGY
tara:strand:- start:131 stop:328 length:198 start_codon:yes stop_codon:yes gene_type:complete